MLVEIIINEQIAIIIICTANIRIIPIAIYYIFLKRSTDSTVEHVILIIFLGGMPSNLPNNSMLHVLAMISIRF